MKIIDQYIDWLNSENKSQATIKNYKSALEKLIMWFIQTENEDFQPNKVTTMHLYEFQAYMDKIKKYEPAYSNKIIASLKTFFKFTTEKYLTAFNPALKVKIKRTMKQYAAPKWLGKLEAAKYFHAISNENNDIVRKRDMAICRLMAGAGLRVKEVSDLIISDICLKKKMEDVTIRNGKGNKYRIVPLNGDATQALQEWLDIRNPETQDAPYFLSERKTQLSDRSIRYMVYKYAKVAGLENVSPHTLRHTFCKSLVDHGVPLQRVAYLAGHESLETTRRYVQPSKSDLRYNGTCNLDR
ncbi:tyrosine-type recombinase/integrase [Marinisporobacter balticus]|uniref:Integrase/recombinase XerC n=1 Tax=Marinisporobacter balticus TaxID=2018667 RepID=A0A4R2KRA0_9FIRM|nr:tyrosine-type recombinase/integrase [Marinisporobacter balticus]TCO69145.1 integrase/recombinase XerC [Marinisporobacter balticus]